MQYVGQTCRTLQKRFGEHYRRIRKPKNNDTFLYQHFKRNGHSPNDVKKVQVGKNQEKAQSEKDSHSKNRGGKKNQTNNQVLIP